jgi:hypothetical protein
MDRETLPTYFATEHAAGERLELRDFSFNGSTYNADTYAHVVPSLQRDAADVMDRLLS